MIIYHTVTLFITNPGCNERIRQIHLPGPKQLFITELDCNKKFYPGPIHKNCQCDEPPIFLTNRFFGFLFEILFCFYTSVVVAFANLFLCFCFFFNAAACCSGFTLNSENSVTGSKLPHHRFQTETSQQLLTCLQILRMPKNRSLLVNLILISGGVKRGRLYN